MATAEIGGGLPVEAGEHSVTAEVRVSWELLGADPSTTRTPALRADPGEPADPTEPAGHGEPAE